MINIYKFRNGLNIIPRSDGNTAPVSMGDFSVYTTDGKVYYYDGTLLSPLVTEAGTATLTNKTIIAGSNSISNIRDANIAADAAIAFSKLESLPSAEILIGNASNIAAPFAVSGDISLSNTGVTAYTGTVPLNKGGTGQTTKAPAFDALSPMTTGGDIIYGGASGTGLRLGNGSLGQVLTSGGGTSAPTWETPSPGFINPMNSVGDLIVGGASGVATRLGIGSTGQVLTVSGGTAVWAPVGGGTVTSVTASSPLASSGGTTPNISFTGILPVANGGTGSATQNFVDLTTTQSISGAKTFNNALTLTQISTPATPSATHNDLYFKSDGFLYMLDSNGVESLVSPGISGTDWKNDLTFTTGGFGTVGNVDFRYRRIGDSMEVTASFQVGTPVASTAFIQLPASYTIDTTKLTSVSNYQGVGLFSSQINSSLTATFPAAGRAGMLFYDGSTNNQIFFGPDASSGTFVKQNGDSTSTSGDGISITFTIPINGWTVNNGVQPGQHGATFFASSQVTTISSTVTSGTFVTFDNSPALTITPTITGTYRVYGSPTLFQVGANNEANSRIFNTSGGATLLYESQGENFSSATSIVNSCPCESIYTLIAGNTYVFDFQGRTTGGTVQMRGGTADFYMFAELSTNGAGISGGGLTNPMTTGGDIIYGGASGTPTRLANGSAGQVLTSAGGTSAPTWAASGSFDYFASSQVTTNSSSITGTSFATFSNSPSFTFTPNFTGKYKVYCSAPLEASGGPTNALARITNTVGSATLLNEQPAGIFNPTGGNLISSVLTQSVYTLTASTSYTFEIQGQILSGGTGVILAGSAATANNFYIFAERIG